MNQVGTLILLEIKAGSIPILLYNYWTIIFWKVCECACACVCVRACAKILKVMDEYLLSNPLFLLGGGGEWQYSPEIQSQITRG